MNNKALSIIQMTYPKLLSKLNIDRSDIQIDLPLSFCLNDRLIMGAATRCVIRHITMGIRFAVKYSTFLKYSNFLSQLLAQTIYITEVVSAW